MIRTGIFGTHGHTEKFIDLLRNNGADTVVLWNDHEEEGIRVSAKTGIPYENDMIRAMEEYSLDAIVVTVPAYMHCRIVCEAAKRNIHIFLEKPLCTDPAEAAQMRGALHRSKGKFYMSDPFVRGEVIQMKRLIEGGKLGDITSAYFRVCGPKNWDTFDLNEQQGGIISSIGGHALHMIHYLFGMPLSAVSMLEDKSGHGCEDNASVIFRYPDGLLVSMQASWVSGAHSNRAAVYGTKGFAAADASESQADLDSFIWMNGEKGKMDIEVPAAPAEHIDYFMKMIREDLDNSIVGVDDDSNRGVSIDDSYELVQMIRMIYEGEVK